MRRMMSTLCLLALCLLVLSLSGCFGDAAARYTCSATSGLVPLEVLFDGSGSRGNELEAVTEYLWDFGDGTVGSGKTTGHVYEEAGSYVPVLTIITASGATASSDAIFAGGSRIVALIFPTAAFAATPDEASASLEVSFDGTLSAPQSSGGWFAPADTQRIDDYAWDFGDGTTGTGSGTAAVTFLGMNIGGEPVKHTYTTPGEYTVALTVTDNYGHSDTATQTITVGTPGGDDDDDDDEDLDEGFDIGTITWEPGDEQEGEGDCVFIEGTVQNNASVAAGVELTATAYNATSNPVGTFTYWPAGETNIGVGVNYSYGFFLCGLSIPGEQVVTVEVVVSGAAVY